MEKKSRMKAAVLKAIKQPLQIEEVDVQTPGQEEVIVDLYFGGLNHRDVWISKGQYAGIQLPCILGSDGSGMLEDRRVFLNPSLNWGANALVQALDYKILGLPDWGTFAEQICINRSRVHDIPVHLSIDEAAAIPLAGLTAYRALITKCQPQVGEKVLISGIGGGVALFAMQFALAVGCEVYVTSSSEEKIARAIELGAKGGVSYKNPDFGKQIKALSGGIDVVIDAAAGDGFSELVKVCNPGGRLCFYGGTAGAINKLNPQIIFWKQLSILGSTMGTDQEFKDMLSLVSKHKIRPIIDTIFPLKDINHAFKHMQEGGQFGKILISHKDK